MRVIDADELHRIESMLMTDTVQNNKIARELLEQVLYDIENMPTIEANPISVVSFENNA